LTDPARADSFWMTRALDLAREGMGVAHPNPRVGAVLVRNGAVVGEGYHVYDQLDHAEIVALKQAGLLARGSTLYVNLEPCSHTGRTGPCTDALIDAGIKRVVAAMADPNPAVAGKGFAQLRKAKIEVTTEVEEDEAQRLNEDFTRWITTKLPFVTLKAAVTLDGQIAMRRDQRTQITGEAAQAAVQRMRHAADAVLTGIGTVLADDPRLTDRTGEPRRRKLLRAVVDSRLRLSPASQLVRTAQDDVLVFTTQSAKSPKARELAQAGVEVLRVRTQGKRVDLREVMKELGRRQVLGVMLEAGAELNGAALMAGIVDKMVLFYAPKLMGTGGVPFAKVPARLFPQAPALCNLTLHGYGHDFAVEGYLSASYASQGARGQVRREAPRRGKIGAGSR
jgi:diaminohydroxyphosphoribosylaminopyrimidine deaminase / 5-amino-6-(5-phosphoribosylamino)uracil reductase